MLSNQICVYGQLNVETPVISEISPSFATVGLNSRSLRVFPKTSFGPGSTIYWNGAPMATSFANDGSVRTFLGKNSFTQVGVVNVTVVINSQTGPKVSNSVQFTIRPQPSTVTVYPGDILRLHFVAKPPYISGNPPMTYVPNHISSDIIPGTKMFYATPNTSYHLSLSVGGIPLQTIGPYRGQDERNDEFRFGELANFWDLRAPYSIPKIDLSSIFAGTAAYIDAVVETGSIKIDVDLSEIAEIFFYEDKGSGGFGDRSWAKTTKIEVISMGNPPPIGTANPVITSLVPSSTTAGLNQRRIRVLGSGFNRDCGVVWNGTPLGTVFVNSGQLESRTPAGFGAAPGTAEITVVDHSSKTGKTSNPVSLRINSPLTTPITITPGKILRVHFKAEPPFTTALPPIIIVPRAVPSKIIVPDFLFPHILPGASFAFGTPNTTLVASLYAGNKLIGNTGTFKSEKQMFSFAGFDDLGTFSSPQTNFSSILSGAPGFYDIAVKSGSIVVLTDLNDFLEMELTFQDIYAPLDQGAWITTIRTEVLDATIPPVIQSLTPNALTPGASTMTVTGSGFLVGATVVLDGLPVATNYISANRITAAIPATLLATQGNVRVSVQNPGGLVSNVLTVPILAQIADPTILNLSALPGGSFGGTYTQEVSAAGGTPPYIKWVVSSGILPQGISLLPGASSGTVQLVGSPSTGGSYSFSLQVTDSANKTASKQFTLTINGGPATLASSGIVNSASYAGGRVSPGEIVTIYGSFAGPAKLMTAQLDGKGFLTRSLDGAQVLFDGAPTPLIYASAGQMSAVVPYDITGKAATQIQISYQGQLSNSVTLPVADALPGIFTSDSTGKGQGAILNQDGTVNSPSQPAAAGSVVVLYATGEGQTNPGGSNGKLGDAPLPTPIGQPVIAMVGGVSARVLYAGGAPGLVAGLLQVNLQLPGNVAAGNAVPVTLSIGGSTSQPGVTLAIRPPPL